MPYINCDFPIRLSCAFYNFPDIRLAELNNLGGYEADFKLQQINDYFRACVQFYYDSKFWEFYQKYRPHYDQWIASFNRNLYGEKMLAIVDSFYRIPPSRKIVFTLGALNCGSYSVPDLSVVNPDP